MENNMQEKKLYRSNTNRVIFGVCGGLGEYFNIDPIIFRIIFIALSIGAGSGVLIYLILAFLIPKNSSSKIGENKFESINAKERINELVSELKDLRGSANHHKRSRLLRLFIGLLIISIGLSILNQNLNLIPGFHVNFSIFINLWPLLLILLGFSILLKGFDHQ